MAAREVGYWILDAGNMSKLQSTLLALLLFGTPGCASTYERSILGTWYHTEGPVTLTLTRHREFDLAGELIISVLDDDGIATTTEIDAITGEWTLDDAGNIIVVYKQTTGEWKVEALRVAAVTPSYLAIRLFGPRIEVLSRAPTADFDQDETGSVESVR